MDEVVFEKHGQAIVAYVDRAAHRRMPFWRVDVDAVDMGYAFPASSDDEPEDVMRRVVEWLGARAGLRVPETPFRWSVLDTHGREWWARLTQELEPGMDPRVGRQLVLHERKSGVEQRLSWMEGARDPRAEELRRLIGRFTR
jgi:hypothetical protein